MEKVILFVTYTMKQGMRDAFVNEVISSGLLEDILNEDGCCGYEYYLSVNNEDTLLLVEQWETIKKQKQHTQHENMTRLKAFKEMYVSHTEIQRITFERF